MMTPREATAKAHALWREEGRGVAVAFRPALLDRHGRLTHDTMVYQVGVAKDEDSMHVYGRSTKSFEDAFHDAATCKCGGYVPHSDPPQEVLRAAYHANDAEEV